MALLERDSAVGGFP